MAPEQERATAVPAASQAQPRPSPPAQAQQAIDLAGALGMHVLKRLAPRWPAWCSVSSWGLRSSASTGNCCRPCAVAAWLDDLSLGGCLSTHGGVERDRRLAPLDRHIWWYRPPQASSSAWVPR
jgi:hypothetical protein